MKRFLKIVLYLIASIIGIILIIVLFTILWVTVTGNRSAKKYMLKEARPIRTIVTDGFSFRDLNKNDKLDIYEDSRQPLELRVNDLLLQMNLEEKAGTMFIQMISMKKDGNITEKPSAGDIFSLLIPGTSRMVYGKKLNHFNILTITGKKQAAEWYNRIQKLAEQSRLGIPVTIASDPRNHFSNNPLMSVMAGDFSLFPEPLGLAAINDSIVTWQFADIARQEYLATGIRVALHPMADLATEPRWIRMNGTFGEDARLSAKLTAAYIKGFQGDSLGVASVACMTKHFSGGGPQKEGIDPHLDIAKGQIYPGYNFKYHLIPFEAAFRAGTAEIMPYYGIPMDQTSENVGFSFNKDIITGMLRKHYRYDGVICTDWGIISDTKIFGITILHARARGMEKATEEDRMLKVMNAGVDQFGGESNPEILIKFVMDGKVSESRIDSSVRRLLRVKFELGLFENPFVDVEKAEKIIGNADFRAAGELAQRKSIVLLKNGTIGTGSALPLKQGLNIFIKNIDPQIAGNYGTVVKSPEQADVAIIRINTPSIYLKGSGLLGLLMHGGDLDFKGKEKEELLSLMKKIPTITDIYIDRPAVIPEIAEASKGLIADFGANDGAILDIIFGKFSPQGKLPVELPSSMEAVKNQKEDVPFDSEDPLFPFGFGLSY